MLNLDVVAKVHPHLLTVRPSIGVSTSGVHGWHVESFPGDVNVSAFHGGLQLLELLDGSQDSPER
jgi:hypothetical protein